MSDRSISIQDRMHYGSRAFLFQFFFLSVLTTGATTASGVNDACPCDCTVEEAISTSLAPASSAPVLEPIVPPEAICESAGFSCKNGGYFEICEKLVPCETCRRGICNLDRTASLMSSEYACTCPEGFAGVDCSVVLDQSYCPKGQVLVQDTLEDIEPFSLVCEIRKVPSLQLLLGPVLHSIMIESQPGEVVNGKCEPGTMNMKWLQRNRNGTATDLAIENGWVNWEIPDYLQEPISLCDIANELVDCDLTDCSATEINTAQNPEGSVEQMCGNAECNTCSQKSEFPLCGPSLGLVLPQINGKPFSFIWEPSETPGRRYGQLSLAALYIPFVCFTGRCRDAEKYFDAFPQKKPADWMVPQMVMNFTTNATAESNATYDGMVPSIGKKIDPLDLLTNEEMDAAEAESYGTVPEAEHTKQLPAVLGSAALCIVLLLMIGVGSIKTHPRSKHYTIPSGTAGNTPATPKVDTPHAGFGPPTGIVFNRICYDLMDDSAVVSFEGVNGVVDMLERVVTITAKAGEAVLDRMASMISDPSDEGRPSDLGRDPDEEEASAPGPGEASFKRGRSIKKKILKEVSCVVEPGEMFAIMGPSGAGKSTLLGIVTKRLVTGNGGVVGGYASLIGPGETQDSSEASVAYVPQADCLLGTETAREALTFTASLCARQQNSGGDPNYVNRQVENILDTLNLSDKADTMIGGLDQTGLSGGEKKRLSIGLALVTKPSLLVLDEPTTGLDSFNSEQVIDRLRDLVQRKCTTVLLTIHQPSPHVFFNFTSVMIIATKGRMAYFGPPSRAADFIAASTGRTISEGMGHCEFIMDVVANADYGLGNQLMQAYQESELGQQQNGSVNHHIQAMQSHKLPTGGRGMSNQNSDRPITAQTPFFTQLGLLMRRQWRRISRDPSLMPSHIITGLGCGVVMGIAYFDINRELSGIQNRAGFFFMMTISVSFMCMSAISAFISDRAMLVREYKSGLYSSPALFIAVQLSDLFLLRLVPVLIMCTITYPMASLTDSIEHYLFYVVIMILTVAIAALLCFLMSVLIGEVSKANLVTVMMFGVCMMFGGLLTSTGGDMEEQALANLQYLSFMFYSWSALMVSEFKDIDVVFNPDGYGALIIRGEKFLDTFGLDPGSLVRNVIVLAGFYVALTAISAFALSHKLSRM
mmetsp:Transcript_25016/g.30264  ORF Transcript_25016/g.30264 Transcript_25016/m.30264 type:complete len:1155 (+) Transcript_25016:382-3846(+)|eukprot:CAMPEP_0197844034 /NCGR_PEP_ID=MMETSP1438-20131217/997_1 /TAXON_ID=1461541 /ORGANISM="Pterosperma sp., Strain CCMP1384" /LENGTH=1154 /DNA_ID=CAMNT_0043454569 /DNA_START=355 /DNA_END=3819 /DNA_ORIENTATION=-